MATNVPTTPDTPGNDAPEKYIRTFAGDMETLQKGGNPDLVPLDPSYASARDQLIEASPVATPAPKPAARLPEPVPLIPKPPPPPEVAPLKTYEGDFSDRVKEKKASTATILAAEQDMAPQDARALAPASRRGNWLYIIAGAVLLIAGVAGAYIAYQYYAVSRETVVSAPGAAAPIFVDERQEISGSGDALLKAVAQSSLRPLPANSVRLLFTAGTTTESVFSQLPLSAPYILVRNTVADGSMVGVINTGGAQSPFFILSVSSYSSTFSGMLAWETTMQRDLGILFQAYPPQAVSTSTPATTRASGLPYGFDDEVMSNHDVRVYRDTANRVVLLYGYWNQSTLVIARSEAAFSEISKRLANSRAQ